MITQPVGLLLVALGWLVVPGLVVGLAIGLRGWLLAGAAPVLTAGFVGVAGVVFAAAGIGWTPATVPVALAVLALVLAAPSLVRSRLPRVDAGVAGWPWWQHAAGGIALLVAGALGVRNTWVATGEFDGVNQTWDAFFHAGAIRYIAETADPSPAALAAIGAPASTHFYLPDAYHCLAALVYRTAGEQVVAVINAMAALLPLLLGLGLVALLRVATGRPAHALCAALGSAVVAAVPYQVVGYGTLLPYATALVLLPAVLGLVVVLLRAPGWRVGVALGLAAAGLLHAHPQVAFLAAMIAVAQVGWHVAGTRSLPLQLLGALGVAGAVAVAAGAPVLVALTTAVTRADGIDWPAYTSPAGAVGDLLLFSAADTPPQWLLVPLLLAGFAAVLRGGSPALRPLLAAAVVVAALYVAAGAYDTPLTLRLTSLWWNDRHRLAAAFAVLAIVFCAIGAVWLRDAVAGSLRRRAGGFGPAAVLVLVLVGSAAVTGGYEVPARAVVATAYGPGPVLSNVERQGLADVARIVAAGGGGTVMNDPHDGCGWLYALHGTRVVFPTPLTGPFDWADFGYDRMRLHDRFDHLDTDPVVRADAAALGVRWAVLCTGFIRGWQARAPGLYDVGRLPEATPIYDNGEVRLFRIAAPRARGATW